MYKVDDYTDGYQIMSLARTFPLNFRTKIQPSTFYYKTSQTYEVQKQLLIFPNCQPPPPSIFPISANSNLTLLDAQANKFGVTLYFCSFCLT